MVPEAATSEEPLSGLSGSPVFVVKSQGGLLVPYLADVMRRASKISSIGRFVDSKILCRALEAIRVGSSKPVSVII